MVGTRAPVIGLLATDDPGAHYGGGGFAKWSLVSSSGPPANKVAFALSRWVAIGPALPTSALRLHLPQEETIHALKGRYKIQIGEEIFICEEGGFAYLPSNVPHAFLNLTDEQGEIVVVYTPGGGHKFYEELGPATRRGTADRETIAAIFEKHHMTLLGPPLSAD